MLVSLPLKNILEGSGYYIASYGGPIALTVLLLGIA